MKKMALLSTLLFLSACASQPNYQGLYDNYSYSLDKKVQNGEMSQYEADSLKMQYANQLNQNSQMAYAYRQQSLSNMQQTLQNRSRNSAYRAQASSPTNCTTRPDYNGGYQTTCY